jgi:[protein-PII] uridylyltransferase
MLSQSPESGLTGPAVGAESFSLKAAGEALLAEAGPLSDGGGRRFCEAFTAKVDGWLAGLLDGALTKSGRRDSQGICLVAVGGYGRRELCPASDLDILLIHDSIKDIAPIADAVWYPIWDAAGHMDHSVRTPRQTSEVVRADLKAALSLLNGRHVAGDAQLSARVIEDGKKRWSAKPAVSLKRLRLAMEDRWEQHGELAFLLEPDLKLARGGLRDVETLRAASIAAPVVGAFLQDSNLAEAADWLLALRVALHASTGRRSDLLLLEDQDAVAHALELNDAEALLKQVAAAGSRIAWVTDQVWGRTRGWLAGPRALRRLRPVQPGVALAVDELVLDGTADPSADSSVALHLVAASATTGISVAAAALEELEGAASAPPHPWPKKTRDALLDLLECGKAAVPHLETLDHRGLLERYFPEWKAVRNLPQRNVYHRYTVDRHLFETAAEAAALTRDVHRPDILLVGALLHDLGKGYPGDPSKVGARLSLRIALRMGFAADDVATISRLVGNHLLLSETVTGRDLSDPATIDTVADLVGSVEELKLLAALTKADALATGPGAWNAWKSSLLKELVIRTRAHFEGDRQVDEPAPTPAQRQLMASGRLAVVPEGSQLTVVAPDRPGLLATVAGVLAVHRLPVRGATVLGYRGMALEVFELDLAGRDEPDYARLEADIGATIADPADLEAKIERRARSLRLPRRPGAALVAAPRVLFDNAVTPRATVVEVRAADGVGLLYRISRALSESGCDISVAKVLTLGHEAVDTFYVTEGPRGPKINDAGRLAGIEAAILEALADKLADNPASRAGEQTTG